MIISPLENKTGKPVDWWFMYKLPDDVGPKKYTKGFEFLYCDANSTKAPELSDITMESDRSASALTLNQLFGDDPDSGYILWNDEIPPTKDDPKPSNNGGKGHSKGILAFNRKTDSGFYLLHSTPRFPAIGTIELPDNERKYGQTYLCVSFSGFATANQIAEILRLQNEVQVYASKLPNIEPNESLAKLANSDNTPIPDITGDLNFTSRNGAKFRLLAKNKRWSEPEHKGEEGKDFWKDLVGPTLKCNLNVETWRRGMVFDDIDTGIDDVTEDVLDIDFGAIGLTDYKWTFTKDHAKWGISVEQPPGYVIIADINRQESQEKRGGGGLVFEHPAIWQALKSAEIVEDTVESKPHKDKA